MNFLSLKMSKSDLVVLLKLVSLPLVFAAMMGTSYWVTWSIARNFGLTLTTDKEIFNSLVGGAWTLLANIALAIAWQKRYNIDMAVCKGNKEVFMSHVNRQIPPPIGGFIGVLAIMLLVYVLMQPYQNIWAGTKTMLEVSFLIALYRQLAVALDNPIEGWVWPNNQIPIAWIKEVKAVNVDKVLKRRAKLKNKPPA